MEKTFYAIGSIASLAVTVYVLFLLYLAYKQHKTLMTWEANKVEQNKQEEVKNTEKKKKQYKFTCKWLQTDTKYLLWRIGTINKEHLFYTERTKMIERGLKAAINRFLNKNAEFLGGTNKEPQDKFFFASDSISYQMIKQIVKENK